MVQHFSFSELKGVSSYFVGIKGTGMTALAEIFLSKGATVTGSDTEEKFYTDRILQGLGISYFEGFSERNIPHDIDVVIYSAAYSPADNAELSFIEKRGIPSYEYTEALGKLSETMPACGISGVHGKTTTTAMIGTILKKMNAPVTVLAGSGVAAFDGRSTYTGGNDCLIAETCEYKRHFLRFSPDIIVLTNIEPDHLDYFRNYDDIRNAFISYIEKLPLNGTIIYCADDSGAAEAVAEVKKGRDDLNCIPYGLGAEGDFRIHSVQTMSGITMFRLSGFNREFKIRVPGMHAVLDAAAAAAVVFSLYNGSAGNELPAEIAAGLEDFRGSKRRSEIIGEFEGVLIMDDYGHHPTEIRTTINGLREFYPGKRIIVDFMSHTYSRTEALLDDFASCFSGADMVVLHKIYSSAREKEGRVNGRTLYSRTKENHPEVYYFEEPEDSLDFYKENLRRNDLFITIGAGNNWMVGQALAEFYNKRTAL